MATTKPTDDCEVAWLSQTRSPRPGCQAAWGKALRALTGLFSFLGLLYPYPSNCQTLLGEGQTSAAYFYAPSEATCVNLCGLFEAPLICSVKSSEPLMLQKSRKWVHWSCTIKNCFLDFYVLIRYSVWNSFSVFSLCVAMELQTMKVFNKKRAWLLMIFASVGPGGGGRWAAATCHWEHCTLLVPWKDRGSSPQANQTIPTAGWLPSSALLALHLPLCVSPPQSVPPLLCISHSNRQSPLRTLGPFWRAGPAAWWYYRDNLRLLTPSPATNIYCAALIYSGLISES